MLKYLWQKIRHRLLCWLKPCKGCNYNMDEDPEDRNLYNWSDGEPIEYIGTDTNYVSIRKERKNGN